MDIINITFLISNKPGILSSVTLSALKLGLKISKSWTKKVDDNNVYLFIVFEGRLNCSETEFRKIMESNSRVEAVEEITFSTTGSLKKQTIDDLQNKTPDTKKLNAQDLITPEIVTITEKKIMAFFGPVAPILVEKAMKKTQLIGELYLLLAEELEIEERHDFLSSVSGLGTEK